MRFYLFLVAGIMSVAGCDRESLYGGSDFSQDVHDSFADCNVAEIKRLSMAHNIQTAFGRCGSNRFSDFSWSPDGVHLYFRLTHGAHILNGEAKTITTVPTEGPTARAAWLTKDILAIPLPPAEGTTSERLAIYNRSAATIEYRELPVSQPKDLAALSNGSTIVFTAIDDANVRRPYRMDINTGETSRAFPWIDQPVTRIAISEKADLLAWSSKQDTELVRLSSGASLHLFADIIRAVPHEDGRWVALETQGAEISHFDQRSWNEVSPSTRKRELARQKKWAERQPEWVEMNTRPPEIQLFDMTNGARHRVTAFWGREVQWYPAKGHYLAFIMWGIEGKQLNRNVALTSMAERIRMIDAGQMPLGMEAVSGSAKLDSPKAH